MGLSVPTRAAALSPHVARGVAGVVRSGVLLALAIAALVGQALLALATWFNHRQLPDAEAETPLAPDQAPPLLVVVPARDEEANIGDCVKSLLMSDLPRLRLRVVDDDSRDATAARTREAAAGDPRFELVAAGALPDGWLGKNHALAVGAVGDEPWLLFVDADVRVAPDALSRALASSVRRDADLFTMMPRVAMRGFWEVAVQPLIAQLIDAWLPAREINDPRHRRAAAIGPFMLFRRAAYARIGGHEAVRGEVVEDLRLAEAIKRAGLRLVYARGIRLATVRMYDSLGAIVRGWTKNFHVALAGALWAAPLVALGLLLLDAGPFALPIAAAAVGARAAWAVALASLAVAVGARLDLARRFGVTARHLWLAPLGACVVAWIVLASALRAATGGTVRWKGRAVR